jgi:hypothetical protein
VRLKKLLMTVRLPKLEPPPPKHSEGRSDFFKAKDKREGASEVKPSAAEHLKAW